MGGSGLNASPPRFMDQLHQASDTGCGAGLGKGSLKDYRV